MAESLDIDINATDRASANISRVGAGMRRMANDLEAAQIRVERANVTAAAAVERYGRDSLQAREALSRLARAEDAATTATTRLAEAQRRAAAEVQDAGDEAEQAVSRWDGLKTAGAAAGAAAGGLMVKGLVDNLNIEAGRAKLQAQLGLTSQQAGDAGAMAGRIYGGNFGESLDSVNESLSVVWTAMQSIGEGSSGQIQKATEAAITLSDAFGVDVTESVRAASTMVKTGLAANSGEAFDIIGKGFQAGLNSSDDLLDTLNEYSPQFKKLGLSGSDALSLISQGMKAGARDTDMIANAVKEFSLRALDGSKTTSDGFQAIGLDATKTAAAIGKGGTSARDAFAQTLAGLRSIEDPVKRNAAGVALMGSGWEDLGPQVVASMSLAQNSIGATTGTIDGMTSALGGTGAAQIETWKRKFEQLVQTAASAPGALGGTAAGLAAIGPTAIGAAGNIGMMVMGFKSLNLESGRSKGLLIGAGKAVTALGVALAVTSTAGAVFGNKTSIGVDTVTKALTEFADTGTMSVTDVAGSFAMLADTGFAGVQNSIYDFSESIAGLRDADLGSFGVGVGVAEKNIAALDAGLASMTSGGHADTAAAAFVKLTETAKANGVSTDQLAKLFPQYRNALDAASAAQGKASTAADGTTTSLTAQKDATKALTEALDANQNKLLQLSGGEMGYYAAVDATTKALKENGKGLEATTEKGRANMTALNAQGKAALDYLQVMQQQGAPAQNFNAQLDQSRKRLYDNAIAFGMTKGEARGYVDAILGIPRQATTNVTLNKDGAQKQQGQYVAALRSIPTSVSTQVNMYGNALSQVQTLISRMAWVNGRRVAIRVDANSANVREGRTASARGGRVPGAPSAADTEPYLLAKGEFVVNSKQTSRHLSALEAINAGRYRGYAAGGMVGGKPVMVAAGGGLGQQVTVVVENHGVIASQREAEAWLAEGVRKLRNTGVL